MSWPLRSRRRARRRACSRLSSRSGVWRDAGRRIGPRRHRSRDDLQWGQDRRPEVAIEECRYQYPATVDGCLTRTDGDHLRCRHLPTNLDGLLTSRRLRARRGLGRRRLLCRCSNGACTEQHDDRCRDSNVLPSSVPHGRPPAGDAADAPPLSGDGGVAGTLPATASRARVTHSLSIFSRAALSRRACHVFSAAAKYSAA
jgi:hypothetical protein